MLSRSDLKKNFEEFEKYFVVWDAEMHRLKMVRIDATHVGDALPPQHFLMSIAKKTKRRRSSRNVKHWKFSKEYSFGNSSRRRSKS